MVKSLLHESLSEALNLMTNTRKERKNKWEKEREPGILIKYTYFNVKNLNLIRFI